MTYTPGIPNAADLLSVSQGQIKNNFTVLNTAFSENHVGLTATGKGKHNACVFPQRTTGPATAATEGALYTKAAGGSPNLYWRRKSSGNEIQMTTNHTPSAAANGFTFLPGGLLLQWGVKNAASGGGAANNVTFPTAFSAAPYSISTTSARSDSANATPAFVSTTSVPTTTTFRIVNTSSNSHNVYWMAIGKA